MDGESLPVAGSHLMVGRYHPEEKWKHKINIFGLASAFIAHTKPYRRALTLFKQ